MARKKLDLESGCYAMSLYDTALRRAAAQGHTPDCERWDERRRVNDTQFRQLSTLKGDVKDVLKRVGEGW